MYNNCDRDSGVVGEMSNWVSRKHREGPRFAMSLEVDLSFYDYRGSFPFFLLFLLTSRSAVEEQGQNIVHGRATEESLEETFIYIVHPRIG